jgi:hypothetical protein
MSLIETCRLNRVNSFDYLVELQRHATELRARPADWLPCNYRTIMGVRELFDHNVLPKLHDPVRESALLDASQPDLIRAVMAQGSKVWWRSE